MMGFNILLETMERKMERLVARLLRLRRGAGVDLVGDAGAIMATLRVAAARGVFQLVTFLL